MQISLMVRASRQTQQTVRMDLAGLVWATWGRYGVSWITGPQYSARPFVGGLEC